jgi:hypothetical protein
VTSLQELVQVEEGSLEEFKEDIIRFEGPVLTSTLQLLLMFIQIAKRYIQRLENAFAPAARTNLCSPTQQNATQKKAKPPKARSSAEGI